jgi:uncharacterized protein (DUF58 family)
VARTGELVIRVRQDEVSPRVEVVLDASASMAVSPEKSARAKEIALWVCELARHGGCEPVLLIAEKEPKKVPGSQARVAILQARADGREPFDVAVGRLPPLQQCGLRVVVSDFLVEAVPGPLAERLVRHAAGAAFIQVLDPEDADPTGGAGARLTDAETAEVLERILTPGVLEAYRTRFEAHLREWQVAARRVSASWLQVRADTSLTGLVRAQLGPLVEAA